MIRRTFLSLSAAMLSGFFVGQRGRSGCGQIGASSPPGAGEDTPREPVRTGCPSDLPSLKQNVARTALQYFLDHTNPVTGLVRTVAENFGPTTDNPEGTQASLAATGFGLAVIANASKQGLVRQRFAFDYCKRTLEFLDENYRELTRRGWFFHYVHWENDAKSKKARRWRESEYSTIDTALFLAGALYGGQVFPHSRVSDLAEKFYAGVDFRDVMTNGDAEPNKRTLSLSYRPEAGPRGREPGYSPFQWSHYAEHMLLLILGLGSPHPGHRLPADVWTAWTRESKTIELNNLPPSLNDLKGAHDLVGFDRALFTHQYSHLFLDFRKFKDITGINYVRNSIIATLHNRQVCRNDGSSKTFAKAFWGLSAGDFPPPASPNPDTGARVGYRVNTPTRYTPIACLGCVPASAMFVPDVVLADVLRWCEGAYGNKIWGRYGLADSITLDMGGAEGWISPRVHGITVGPEFLALANLSETTSVWSDFMGNPHIQRGLREAASAPAYKPQPKGTNAKAP